MKVRIRKALPNETPGYNSSLNSFLDKAAIGMEVQDMQEDPMQSQEADSAQIIDYIKSLFEGGEYFENVVAKFSRDYKIDTDQASDFVKYVQDNYLDDPLLFDDEGDDIKEDEVVDVEEEPTEEPVTYDYNLDEDAVASGDFGDGLDLSPDDVMKFGGSKSKTIKHFKKLIKAAAGTAVEGQASEPNSQPNIRGTVDNPSDPYNNNSNFIGAINNQVKDNFYTKQAEEMYEKQANGQYAFGGNRRIRRANKAFFGTKTAPVGVDTDYKFGLLGNLKEGTIKWDPEMVTNMMQQFGTNQAYQGFGYDPGYGGGSWNSSYNTGWKKTTVPGTIRREKVIKAINNQADPTKVNNVELNNNPAKTSNTAWMGSNVDDFRETWTPEYKAYMLDDEAPWAPLTDPTGRLYDYNTLKGMDYATELPLMENDGYGNMNPIPKDKDKYTNDAYAPNLQPSSPSSYLLDEEYKKANNIKKFTDYTPEQQAQLQDYENASYLTRDKQGNEYSSFDLTGAPDYEENNLVEKKAVQPWLDIQELNKRFQPSGYQSGGFIDPSQMQPGVLQKFISGGYDNITQEDIDFTNSKDTTGTYAYGGGIKKFGPGGPNQVDPNYRDAGGRNYQDYIDWQGEDAIDTDVIGNKMSRQAPLSWEQWKAEQDAEKNPNGTTDRHTTRNTTTTTNTYNNQGYNQGPSQGWYDPRQAAFAISNRDGVGNGSFRDMIRDFLPVTNDGTWFNQTAGSLGAIPEGYALNQVKTSKQRKTDGTWAERKLGFNKDRFVDMSYTKLGAKDNAGVGVYAPGQGVNANMKPGTNNAPGNNTTSRVSDVPITPTEPKAEGNGSFRDRRLDRRVDRWDRKANKGLDESSYRPEESSYRPGSTPNTNDDPNNPAGSTNTAWQSSSTPSNQIKERVDIGDRWREEANINPTGQGPGSLEKRLYNDWQDKNKVVNLNNRFNFPVPQTNNQSIPEGYPANNVGPINTEMAYGGYIPNDYYAYGGYLPKADDGLVGPFVTNNADCTDQQKRDPQSPCYDAKFAIPAFARPGATIQEMMGNDSINCSDEDKLDPESDCYVDPDPNSITKRFKVNKAKTINFGAIGAGANLAGNAFSAGKEAATNVKLGNVDKAKIYTSMGREDMKDTEFRGTTNQEGWDPNAGYESTGRMTAGFAKGGPVNKEGDITYMSSKQIKEFLKNGGQLEFQ